MLAFYATLLDEDVEQPCFEAIYNGFRKQMLVVANRVLQDLHDAEDAVQMALLGIAANIKSVPTGDEKLLRAYVLTAAKNKAITILHQRNRRAEVEISDAPDAVDEDMFEQVTQSQDYDRLLNAMRQLKSPYREVLLLRYVYEKDTGEIAAVLGRKVQTVQQQLCRGKKRLIELCRREGIFLDRL